MHALNRDFKVLVAELCLVAFTANNAFENVTRAVETHRPQTLIALFQSYLSVQFSQE